MALRASGVFVYPTLYGHVIVGPTSIEAPRALPESLLCVDDTMQKQLAAHAVKVCAVSARVIITRSPVVYLQVYVFVCADDTHAGACSVCWQLGWRSSSDGT